jgi:hypothetical protein
MKKITWMVGVACVLAQPLLAREFYVSPEGRDDHPGTRRRPFASLTAARDAVRAEIAGRQRRDITVHIGAGAWFIEEPIVLDDRDAGRDGRTITYKGAPNLATRIYGGRRITNWTRLNEREYVAEVPGLQAHYTLYENERAANGGIFHTFQDAPEGNWRKEGDRLIYHPRALPIEDQVIVLGTPKDIFRIEGRSMTQIAGNLVFDGLHVIGSNFAPEWKKGDSYSTNWDGEYDGRPWGGQKLCDSVIAPDMRHGQFYIENARNVTIRNSRLYGAGFMAAMFNRWAQDCRVENNWIENAGCNGLFFMGWECGRGPFDSVAESYVNKGHVIRNNVFYDIGRFAPYASGVYFNFSGDNRVEHNIFHGITHYGVTMKGWRPMLINEFHMINRDMSILGGKKLEPFDMEEIKLYGEYVVTVENQGVDVNHSRNNVVRYNDMSQIARYGDDMGMISMWGAGTGNVWEYNACHDGVNVASLQHWLHVLFNDDGSHDAVVRGNLVYWITGGIRSRAIMLKGNNQNTVHNIIADCILDGAATIGPYVEQAHHMVWSNNIIAAELQSLYSGGGGTEKVRGEDRPILKEADRNVYFYKPYGPAAEGEARHGERLRGQLEGQKRGGRLEQNSVYADPEFVRANPWWATDYTDYRLQPGSPALALGFEETDTGRIGLRKDYPFDVKDVLAHPAGRIWKAAAFNRLYDCRISGQLLIPFNSRVIEKGAWARYDHVDFGDGSHATFRARVGWDQPQQTFEKEIDGRKFRASFYTDVWIPHPYWEVSPAYKAEGRTGPELFDVAFAPETEPDAVAWKAVTEPMKSRLTVEYPLGVMNLDVATGEENVHSAAYMRSSLFARNGGRTDIEIRGDHGVKLWVNGELVFSQLGGVNQSKRVGVAFKKGWNEMLMKVVQDDQPWKPTEGRGNFWATVNIYYAALGGAFIVPGRPAEEAFIDPYSGTGVELRLNAPDGPVIGELQFGQSTCAIEKTTGRHTLFLVFPHENVQNMDWYRFE